MGKIKAFLKDHVWFDIFSVFTLAMFTGSFFCPPMGAIDSSCLQAAGWIFALSALETFKQAIKSGMDAKIKHGQTEVTIGDLNNSAAEDIASEMEEYDNGRL